MFLFRLAKELGMTVARLQSEMGNDELVEWMAYDRIDPFGDWRGDAHAGIIASVVVNTLSKNGRAKPTDFVLKFSETVAPDPQEALSRIARKLGMFTSDIVPGRPARKPT